MYGKLRRMWYNFDACGKSSRRCFEANGERRRESPFEDVRAEKRHGSGRKLGKKELSSLQLKVYLLSIESMVVRSPVA